jgi:hypothetical protein
MCFGHSLTQACIPVHNGGEHAIFTLDEDNFRGSVFSIASVDINKIMVVFYHLPVLVCPWISVEKIILTLTNFFISFFSSDFSGENSEIQDGCRGHMTTPFTKKFKKFYSPSYISYL